MNFNFIDKTELEADIIAEVLQSENIAFKTKKRYAHAYYDTPNDNGCEFASSITIPIYTITAFTTIEHFEFVKKITEERLKNIKLLNKCFYESEDEDEFFELYQEDFADTNCKHKSIFRWLQILCTNLFECVKRIWRDEFNIKKTKQK